MKILRQHDPFLALMSHRAASHTATGGSPCQLMMGRDIRTLQPTLESNLKPVLPSQEAVTRKDEKTKAAYRQYFNQRPSWPTSRRFGACEVGLAERMDDAWECHCEKPYP